MTRRHSVDGSVRSRAQGAHSDDGMSNKDELFFQRTTLGHSPDRVTLDKDFENHSLAISGVDGILQTLRYQGYLNDSNLLPCLRLACPELIQARDSFLSSFGAVCSDIGFPFEAWEDCFWQDGLDQRLLTWMAYRHESQRRGSIQDSPGRPPENHEEVASLTARLRVAGEKLNEAIHLVEQHLPLLQYVVKEVTTILGSLTRYSWWLNKRSSAMKAEDHKSSTSAPSIVNTERGSITADDNIALHPMPGIATVGSSSSGVGLPPPVPSRYRIPRQSSFSSHQYGSNDHRTKSYMASGRRRTPRSLDWINRWSAWLKYHWSRFNFTAMLVDQRTVWTLVLTLAVFGGVAIALAVWEAGPNTHVPEVDSNFWSTLSQNSIGSAALYCLALPILRNDKLDLTRTSLFRFWLAVSAVGAFISTIIYIVHTRTSMMLEYFANLAQLFATLQLIVDTKKAVTELSDEVEYLRTVLVARNDR